MGPTLICVILRWSSLLIVKVGGTALHYAASRGHVEVAREMLNHKAYVNGRTKVCAKKWHELIESYPDTTYRSNRTTSKPVRHFRNERQSGASRISQ